MSQTLVFLLRHACKGRSEISKLLSPSGLGTICSQNTYLQEPNETIVLNTDSDLMANMYIVLNCRRKLLEHAYGYYGMELKLAFSSL
jgi:hypothetical protein